MTSNNSFHAAPTSSAATTRRLEALLHMWQRFSNVISIMWRLLIRPQLLLTVSLLALATAGAGLLLPQLPSQLHADTAAASRWILTASARYGWIGATLRNLGLFEVLHSALLRFLLTAIGLMLLLQCADLIGRALMLYRLSQYVQSVRGGYNQPLALRRYASIFRQRIVLVGGFDACATTLVERMLRTFERTDRYSVQVDDTDVSPDDDRETGAQRHQATAVLSSQPTTNSGGSSNGLPSSAEPALPDEAGNASELELRIVGVNSAMWAYLRPLLPGGLLLALFATWLIATFGWNMTTPLMAPGDSFSSLHDVIVDYQLPSDTTANGELEIPRVTVASARGARTLGPATVQSIITSFGSAYLGNINLQTVPASPGLIIQTDDGSELLSRPGQTSRMAAIGLAFPVVGSEESVLIPDALTGLRIVHQPAGPNTFVVETYHSSIAWPVQRFEFNDATSLPILTDSTTVDLEFQPSPAIYVNARYLPGTWLLWPAAILTVVGIASILRRPEFLVAQVYAWAPSRTSLILQSNLSRIVETVVTDMNRKDLDTHASIDTSPQGESGELASHAEQASRDASSNGGEVS